jgi:hypothetical protein
MKPAVAIALIVAGVGLVALPPLSDTLWRADAIRLMAQRGFNSVDVAGQMDTPYRFGCYLAGVFAIGIAVRYSVPSKQGKGLD